MPIPDNLSADELGLLLGVSGRTVRELASRGVIAKAGRGRYSTAEAVRAYAAHLREGAALRGGDDATVAARRREAEARAEKIELQNAQVRRDLVPAAEVERLWTEVLADVRARMLAVPARCRSRLGHLTQADGAAIEEEVRDALKGAADAG